MGPEDTGNIHSLDIPYQDFQVPATYKGLSVIPSQAEPLFPRHFMTTEVDGKPCFQRHASPLACRTADVHTSHP